MSTATNLEVLYNPFIIVTLLYLLSSIWEVGRLTRPDRYSKLWAERLPIAAFLLHTVFLILLATRAGNVPITNLYEALILLSWCVVGVFTTVEYIYNVPSVGAFLFPIVTVLSICALYMKGNSLVAPPTLSKFWLIAHIV